MAADVVTAPYPFAACRGGKPTSRRPDPSPVATSGRRRVSKEQPITQVVHEDALGTYLREHIAASHAAEDLSERLIDRSEDPQVAEFLRRFVEEIREERAHLVALLEPIEDERGLIRKGIDVATGIAGKAERLVDLALPAQVAELEALAIGIWGKRLLWGTLKRLAEIDERFSAVPADALSDRAERQEIEMLRLRQDAIIPSFAPSAAQPNA